MKVSAMILAVFLGAGLAAAQRHRPAAVDSGSPEGQLLQKIEEEADDAKRSGLLEQFASQYPQYESIAWIYEMMSTTYTKAGQPDKAIEAGEKLLAIDPADLDAAHACLKAAEAKKDPALVLKWSAKTSELARKVAQTPQPTAEDEVEGWKARVDFAKQVDVYTEYALYAAALGTTDSKARIQLGEALEQRNPESEYMPMLADVVFAAYLQAGNAAGGYAFAGRVAAHNQASPEILLAAASGSMERKDPDKAIALSQKALAAVQKKPKPDGVDAAAWQTWKTQFSGRARWILGVSYAAQRKWSAADEALRAALPAVKSDQNMYAQALFYLGLANYGLASGGQLERARDALRFSEECAQIPGPFQSPARGNVRAISSEFRLR
jgi:tetratricopeptide (TPR) repeat protein